MSRFFFLLAALFLPVQAFALAGDWVKDDAVSARLVSGVTGTGALTAVPLGLELALANGWHTYWRSPGEAGFPPHLDWGSSLSDDGNLAKATLLYPAPQRATAYNLETIGYRDHVLFPIDAKLRVAGKPLQTHVAVDLLVCSDICVPKHVDLALTVPSGAARPSAEADALAAARALIPSDPDHAGLLLKSIANDGHSLAFSIMSRDALTQPDIFIEDDVHIGFSAPKTVIDQTRHSATLTVTPVDTLPDTMTLAKLPVTLTIVDGEHATEIKTVTPAIGAAPKPVLPPQVPLSVALLFALVGGLILNLMPCVLPVLSLKILSVISHGGGEAGRVRQSFLFTAAGILFSFLALALITIGLQKFGMVLGWGIQFQQPAFLILLVIALTFFAANLWGLFEIPLPRALADNLDPTYHPKLAGDFAAGAVATLLATPCSAPFLGTAVGFALASGTAQIFAIFIALGLGLALPYLLIAACPKIATKLPKPGAWMLAVRRFLGLALAATSVWLIWVLAAQITVAYASLFGLLMAAVIGLLIWKHGGGNNQVVRYGVILLCVFGFSLGLNGAMQPKAAAEADRQWLAYDENALAAEVSEGKIVFLDVTADWCLTCKANERFTLSSDRVAQRLFHSDIIAVRADWTNPDPRIDDLLHKYGRYGIPFNVVFGPGAPQGIVLPELLTPTLVLEALDKAEGAP